MKYLFYFGHPAQFLFLRHTIKCLAVDKKNSVLIAIKSKDVLEDLVKAEGLSYVNIQTKLRSDSKVGILLGLMKRTLKLLQLGMKFKPDLIVGTDASVAHVGLLLRVKRITTTEDDYTIIKSLAALTYPFTNHIVCPNVCDVGRWSKKKIGYDGYMKLGYLHPKIFKPEIKYLSKYSLKEGFVLIRLAKLTAHHDFGIRGVSADVVSKLIEIIEGKGTKVYISSERDIPENLRKYILKIEPQDLHHIMYFAKLLISDSQSMSVEAAILGLPSIRVSDFAGRISVLEELESKYNLTYGINPSNIEGLFERLNYLLSKEDLISEFHKKRDFMISEKINVSEFLIWLLGNYPESVNELKVNSNKVKLFAS